jgi:general secretion pathway protein E
MEAFQEQALAYLKGEMGEEEKKSFESALAGSEELRWALERSREILDILEAASEKSVVERVHRQIKEAIARGASDIHVVGHEDVVVVWHRIDGVLHEVERFPKDLLRPVVDRWKAMAECSVNERQVPQDGRIAIVHQDQHYDLRLNIMPTLLGERVTVRILARQNVLLGLDKLGLSQAQHEAVQRLVSLPSGFIATAGPVSSGNTTLLCSMLQELQKPDRPRRNILTIEDPIELLMPGTSQSTVNRKVGLTYVTALRAFMRCDPDILMVGELPDLETAQMALRAVMTGHLVLSTLYTSSALGVIERLKDMGVPSFMVAQSTAGVISQRLVRKVCPQCTTSYEPAPEALQKLGLSTLDGPFRRGSGCEACGQIGYKGRVGLFEVLEVDNELRRLIVEHTPVEALWRHTFGRNGGSLWDDGRAKVRRGITTAEEVTRVLLGYPHPSSAPE